MSEHPSFLELDRLALGHGPEAEAHPHVRGCAECQAHLARLAQPVSMPDWARTLGAPTPRSLFSAWRLPSFAAAAVMVLLAVILVPRVREDRPAWSAKGLPGVVVHFKRGETVSVLGPTERLRPGDAIRLELNAEGFAHYTVLSGSDSGWNVLARGTLEQGRRVLPQTWRVDGVEPEQLRVVFSRPALSEEKVIAAAEATAQGEEVYTLPLVLEKAAP